MNRGNTDRPRVLFVDDEVSLVALARFALERAGWELIPAHNGAQALEIFEEQHDSLDVVVLDLILPGISGQELLDRMAAIDDSVPIVIASGMEAHRIAEIIGERTKHFVQKPFSLMSLPASLNAALSRAAAF